MMFSRTKGFCFENDVFLAFGLSMCKGVGEDSRHGIGHAHIQVGSCISLNAFMLNHCMCTYVWSNPCTRLSQLGIAHPLEGSLFQVQGVFRKTVPIRGRF